jgi:hypothetical protein
MGDTRAATAKVRACHHPIWRRNWSPNALRLSLFASRPNIGEPTGVAAAPRAKRVICPTGCIRDLMSSPPAKNIPLSLLLKSALQPAPSHPHEGRIAIVTDAGWDAVDAAALGV